MRIQPGCPRFQGMLLVAESIHEERRPRITAVFGDFEEVKGRCGDRFNPDEAVGPGTVYFLPLPDFEPTFKAKPRIKIQHHNPLVAEITQLLKGLGGFADPKRGHALLNRGNLKEQLAKEVEARCQIKADGQYMEDDWLRPQPGFKPGMETLFGNVSGFKTLNRLRGLILSAFGRKVDADEANHRELFIDFQNCYYRRKGAFVSGFPGEYLASFPSQHRGNMVRTATPFSWKVSADTPA